MTLKELLVKLRHWLAGRILGYQTRKKEKGGWVYRHERKLVPIFFLSFLAFIIILNYQQLLPSTLFIFLSLAFIFIPFTIGITFIVRFLKIAGKWGLAFVVAFTTIWILWFWVRGAFTA